MTPFEMIGTISRYVAKAVATPGRIVRVARASFADALGSLVKSGLADDLRTIKESELERLTRTNGAEASMREAQAIEAHNRAAQEAPDSLTVRARVEKELAAADLDRAKAEQIRVQTAAIRTDAIRQQAALDRVQAALAKLDSEGGRLFLPGPQSPPLGQSPQSESDSA